MKCRPCEPCFVGSGRLTCGPSKPASFFASKSKMAMLAAASGAMALLMAAKAGMQIVESNNITACLEQEKAREKAEGTVKKKKNKEEIVLEKPILYDPDLAASFRSGFNQQLVHSAALLAVPYVASQPVVTTSLLLSGMAVYCGTQYYKAFSRDPDCCDGALVLGTMTLLGAWLTFVI